MSHSIKSFLMRTSVITAALGLATPAAMAAVVEGKVTAGGAGVEGAVISVVETGQSTATGNNGTYRFSNLPEGDYTLSVTYIGAEDQTAQISATDAAPTAFNFALDAATRVMDSVLITGQRGSMLSGINQQRAADNLVSVLSADALGQFPDQNVAESARRVPGVSVANDQGEGRFVIIRGLDANLNSTSINGVRMTAPESSTRAVALDTVDADILDSIEITKSLTPDLDGDGIGGNINIKTMSAFDKDGLYIKAKADGIYSESSEEWGQKLALTASDTFLNDTLGIAGSIAWNKREFATVNKEADKIKDVDGVYFAEELELRNYEITRERLSGALNFDYKLGASTDLYLRTLYNEFEDQEYRHRATFAGDDGLASIADGVITFTADEEGALEVERDIKNRLETQKIWSAVLGGETVIDAVTIDYSLAYTQAEESEPNRLDVKFVAENQNAGDSFGYNVSDSALPSLNGVDDYFYDLSNFEIDKFEPLNGKTTEDEIAAKLDIRRDGQVFGAPGFVKGGVKLRFKEKDYSVDAKTFEDGRDDPLLLGDVASFTPDYPLDTFGESALPGALRNTFNQLLPELEEQDVDTLLDSFGPRYDAKENVYAGYLMSQSDFGSALVTAGFRVEATEFEADAFVVDENTETATPISDRNSYVDFLPSINARFDVTDSIVARAAYYKSIARPSISAAAPTILVNDKNEAELGNPDLDRQQAHNIDLSLEYYPSSSGVISIGFFHKDIKGYIVEVFQEDFTYQGVTYDEAVFETNIEDDAQITGLEFNYQQSFENLLPSPFDGLIFGANYTLLDSQTTFKGEDGSRSISLPKTSDNIANVVLGYDKYGLDLRLAYSYRDSYIDELDVSDGYDRMYLDRGQLDFTAKYDVTDNLTLVGELSNITDAEEHAVFTTPSGNVLSQYDEYGYTAKLGVRYTY